MRQDITGKRFGLLTAVRPARLTKACNTVWLFNCDCGGQREATLDSVQRPNANCGCANVKRIKHGHSRKGKRSPEYVSWVSMKTRCLNPKHVRYKDYGGAGITIDPRWVNSFEAYLADVGLCPEGCNSIDRINSKGNYVKENVRWSRADWQALNRSNSIVVTIKGITMPFVEACRKYGVKYTTARHRMKAGATAEAAFNL